MKRIILILLIGIVFITTGCSKKDTRTTLEKIRDRDVLVVGVKTDSKPFGFISKKTGNNAGFDVDVAKAIANDILGSDRKIKFVEVTPNTRIEAATSGEVDLVIATMSITPQREYLIDFSKPYYVAGQTAVVKEDSDIHAFADLRKKTTIVVLGTTAEKNLRRIIPTAKIIGFKTYPEAFQAFLEGEGDAISSDDAILSGFLHENPGYRILKNRISKEPYAVGMKQIENDKSLKNSVDVVITRMAKDGSLKELKNKWKLH